MLYLLVNIGFQVLFHSPPGVLFTFPSRYFFSIGHQVVFSLTGWSPLFHTRFLVSRTTLDPTMLTWLSYTGLSPSMVCFPKTFLLVSLVISVVRTPSVFLLLVWALPISLATTLGIDFSFFSYRYWDVSVPCVPLHILLYSYMNQSALFLIGVPSFGYLWINGYLLLPIAFRSLSRPSSALGA